MNKEIWKPIKEYKNLYEVSNLGNVRRLESEIITKKGSKRKIQGGLVKLSINEKSVTINLCKNGKAKTYRVNRLIAEAFVNNSKGLQVVNNKDNNKLNNSADNLEWVSVKDICIHSLPHREARFKRRKLNDEGKKYIIENKDTYSDEYFAKLFECRIVDIWRVYETT